MQFVPSLFVTEIQALFWLKKAIIRIKIIENKYIMIYGYRNIQFILFKIDLLLKEGI